MAIIGPEYETLARAIPEDHARTSRAPDVLAEALPASHQAPGLRVLDFGCGDGRGADIVARLLPGAVYTGVDIESSPEVDSRRRIDANFVAYDGMHLPFEDASFDVVYSKQVFEHVRHPDAVTAEIARVLVPGGIFAGSMSNLEPYHSYSIFNYTPWGVFRLVEENGLRLEVMRPGPEGIALVIRQLSLRWISLGFVYPAIWMAGLLAGWDAKRRNYLKLRFSGQICFVARRPTD